MPAFLTQVKAALGLPAAPLQDAQVPGPSSAPPAVSLPAAASGVPPPIVLENSESDEDVQTLAVPIRSGSSEAFLPLKSRNE